MRAGSRERRGPKSTADGPLEKVQPSNVRSLSVTSPPSNQVKAAFQRHKQTQQHQKKLVAASTPQLSEAYDREVRLFWEHSATPMEAGVLEHPRESSSVARHSRTPRRHKSVAVGNRHCLSGLCLPRTSTAAGLGHLDNAECTAKVISVLSKKNI